MAVPPLALSALAQLSAPAHSARATAHSHYTPRNVGSGDVLKSTGFGLTASAGGASGTKGPRLSPDTVPDVRASGKACGVDHFARGLGPDVIVPTPRTPDGLGAARERHRKRTEPGEPTVHWAQRNVRHPEPYDGYGIASSKGLTVAKNFRAGELVGIAEYINMRNEAVYKSSVQEPLGKCATRVGYKLPASALDNSFAGFGRPTPPGAVTAKDTIFAPVAGGIDDDPAIAAMYKRTHGDFDAGEMYSRKYEWPASIGADPQFRFGATSEGRSHTVGEALSMDCEDESGGFPQTRVVSQSSENYKRVAEHRLGQGKNLMQSAKVKPGHTFGLKSGLDETDAGELIRGFYNEEEQKPDADLGRCTVSGRRNFITPRSMGVPTVRTDRQAPPMEKRSIANSTNYGDDTAAYCLLFPYKFQFRGISDNDFKAPRGAEEMRDILAGAGHPIRPEDFAPLYAAAVAHDGRGDGHASLAAVISFASA